MMLDEIWLKSAYWIEVLLKPDTTYDVRGG